MNHTKNIVWIALLVDLLVVLIVMLPLAAQDESKKPSLQEAMKLFQAKDWENAAHAYEAITKREPSNGQAWLMLGLSHHSMKQYEEAVNAYEQAENLKFALPRMRYNLACAYSLMNKKEEAFQWLNKALDAGFRQVQLLKTDTDLANIRDQSRFQQFLEQANKNSHPCEYDPKYRQFDFWVGEWDVFNPQGQKVGTNIIQKILNGCLILENWTSGTGGIGKSINYYDPSIGKWKQNWVDSDGGVVWYEGEIKDGAMHFKGENIARDGSKKLTRVILKPLGDGRLHHFIEHSKDGGKTWYVYFDATYIRKTNEQQSGEIKSIQN